MRSLCAYSVSLSLLHFPLSHSSSISHPQSLSHAPSNGLCAGLKSWDALNDVWQLNGPYLHCSTSKGEIETLHTHYIHTTYTLHTHCIHTTYTLHTHYIHTTYTLHTHCIHTTYTLHTHYIHTT